MLTSLALAGPAAQHWIGPWAGPGFGFGFFFLLIPLFWIAIIALFVGLGRRRWRRGWAMGHAGFGGWGAARSAESTLAERFANGDIDEKEYRARLEVIRANAPQFPGQR